MSKFQLIQSEASQSENFKESLLEKANDLEGTIEKSEEIISDYESRILELENQVNQQRLHYDSEKVHL